MSEDRARSVFSIRWSGIALALLVSGCGGQATAPPVSADPGTYTFKVDGMHCGGCERSITAAVEDLQGIEILEISHSNGMLRVESDGQTGPHTVISAMAAMVPQSFKATLAAGHDDGGSL